MPRPLNKPGRELLLEAINLANVEQFSLADISLGAPVTTTLFGKNTTVMVNGSGGKYCGSQPLYYFRLDIEELFSRSCTGRARIDLLQPTTIESIVHELNTKYELFLQQEDIVEDFGEVVDPVDGPLDLTISMGSYTYYGAFRVYFEDTLINIDIAIYDQFLDGLNYVALPNSPPPGPDPDPDPGTDPDPVWGFDGDISVNLSGIQGNAFVSGGGWYFNSTKAASVEAATSGVESGFNATEPVFNIAKSISEDWIVQVDVLQQSAKRFNRDTGTVTNGEPDWQVLPIPASLLALDWMGVYGTEGNGGDWVIFDALEPSNRAVTLGWNHATGDVVLFRAGPSFMPADTVVLHHDVAVFVNDNDLFFGYYDLNEPYTGANPDVDHLVLVDTGTQSPIVYPIAENRWLIQMFQNDNYVANTYVRGGSLEPTVITSRVYPTQMGQVIYTDTSDDSLRVFYYDQGSSQFADSFLTSRPLIDIVNIWNVRDGLVVQFTGESGLSTWNGEDGAGLDASGIPEVWTILSRDNAITNLGSRLVKQQVVAYTLTEAGDPVVYVTDGGSTYEIGTRSELGLTDVNTKIYVDIMNFEGFVVL